MKIVGWVLAVVLTVFFVVFGLNKFIGFMPGTQEIFAKSGALFGLADFFQSTVIYIVGIAEILAGLLILNPGTRKMGASLGLLVVIGALFFHLFSPLGINVKLGADQTGDGGMLFIMAVVVFVLTAATYWIAGRSQHT